MTHLPKRMAVELRNVSLRPSLSLTALPASCGIMVERCLSLLSLDAWIQAVKLSVIGCNNGDLGCAIAASVAI